MFKLCRFVSLCLTVVGLGCGGKEPAKAPAQVIAAPPSLREEAPDMSRVAAPKDLVLYARFSKPESSIATVSQWAGLPLRVRSLLPPNLQGLEKIIAWDAPVEAAVALDPLGEGKLPEPLAVFSIGLTSLDSALDFARKQGDAAPRVRPGVYRLEESGPLNCLLSVALGTAPARIICGKRRKDVDGLGPFAARGLPAQPAVDAELEINFLAEPLQRRYASEIASGRMLVGLLLRQLQLDSPRFDRALADAAYGVADELVAFTKDVDRIRIEGKVDARANAVDLSVIGSFRGSTSWIVQLEKDLAGRVAPPPPDFFKLPADAHLAAFGVSPKPELVSPIGRTLGELLEGYLEYKKVAPRTREEWKRLIETAFQFGAQSSVWARGALPGPLAKEKERRSIEASLGWTVGATTADTKQYDTFLSGALNAFTSRELRKLFEEEHRLKDNDWPKHRVKPIQVPGFKTAGKLYELTLTDAFVRTFDEKKLAEYAKIDAADVKAPAEPKAKAAKPFKITISLIIVNDGPLTWFGFSTDQKMLLEKLKTVRDDKAPQLGSRSGLEDVRKTAAVSGGFLSLRYILDAAAGSGEEKMVDMHTKLPNHGETPIPFWASATTGSTTTTSLKFRIPDKVVADIAALAVQMAPTFK